MFSRAPNRSIQHGWWKLVTGVVVLAIIWMLLLPMVARRPSVAGRIERLEAKGIDPTAIFYTELDAMEAAEARVLSVRASGSEDVLW